MKKTKAVDIISLIVATLFGVGYTPLCPGTAACVVALIFYLLIPSQLIFFLITLFVTIIAFLVSGRAEKLYGVKDCKKIVIDDFAGMLITLLFLPRDLNILFIPAAFFLFRMLDMLKIPPADKIEKYPGSRGIVGDDVVAGLYALGVIQAVRLLVNILS
jgi:phosphatidylglycerophosphatase A